MWRSSFIFWLLTLAFVVIDYRLFHWQVLSSDSLRQQAASQYFLEFQLPPTRGSIFDQNGNSLAIHQPASLVYAQPKKIENVKSFAAKISDALGLDEKEVVSTITQPDRFWVALSHKVEQPIVEKLKELNLAGLGFEKEAKRYYPEASMAAHLLGFVGSDERGSDKGYFGLEGYYDRQLVGRAGALRIEKDAKGNPILIGDVSRVEPQHGRSLTLWLDRAVERIVERRLAEGIAKYGAKEGSVIVMDPKTGGILAMATFPNYDPATYSTFPSDMYKNPLVSATYEPGSTFKVLVMSGALEEKLVTPTTTMEETGPVEVGEYAVQTWNNEYHGEITMTKVLERSSNVGMVFVGRKLGKEKLIGFMKQFGFGESTGIDLEEETSPGLRPSQEWREIDLATASFGQGIAVTPIQMVRAVGALANNGALMEPHVVSKIIDESGKSIDIKPKKVRQVISGSTARIITEMMVAAVDNGEAKWAKPAGYRIAGKTGTAQIPVAGHYDKDKTIASFVGFAPADNPKFVMLVTLREPSTSPWGSETAAPLFFTISRDLFAYWGISPQ